MTEPSQVSWMKLGVALKRDRKDLQLAKPSFDVCRKHSMAIGSGLRPSRSLLWRVSTPEQNPATWRDRIQRPDCHALSRCRSQPAIVKEPENSSFRRSKVGEQRTNPQTLVMNEGPKGSRSDELSKTDRFLATRGGACIVANINKRKSHAKKPGDNA